KCRRLLEGRLEFSGALRHAAVHGSQIVDGPVASYSQNPGSERAFLLVNKLGTVPDAKKRLLREVFRYARIFDNSKDDRENKFPVAVIDFTHPPLIPPLQLLDQTGVVI